MAASSIEVRVVREAPDGWWHKPLRRMFEDWVLMAHGHVARAGRVPIDTGNLRSSLQPGAGVTGVDGANPPTWARVGTNVEYGGILDASDKHHYASGPSAGKPLKGWLTDSPETFSTETNALIDDLAAALTATWGKV